MTSWLTDEIPTLLAMAHDRSEAGRIALAEKVSEIFLINADDLPPKEEELVHKFIEEIIHHESEKVRHALISEFANSIHAQRSVALRVSRGPIEIAHATLTANENLEDDDLITIIEDKGSDHAAAIAQRSVVSEAVADALVTTGSVRVIQMVAENLGAQLSPNAIDVLVNTARLAAMVQKPLLQRPELNADKALELFWWVSKDLRREALERYGFGPGRLDSALTQSVQKKLETHLFEKDDDEAMVHLANWLSERDSIKVDLLPRLLRMNHYRLFSIALSRMVGLNLDLVDAVVTSVDVRMIVALCKSLNIEKSHFVSIFLMSRAIREDEQIVHPKELSVAMETFDRLSVEDSKALVQSWVQNPSDLLMRSYSN